MVCVIQDMMFGLGLCLVFRAGLTYGVILLYIILYYYILYYYIYYIIYYIILLLYYIIHKLYYILYYSHYYILYLILYSSIFYSSSFPFLLQILLGSLSFLLLLIPSFPIIPFSPNILFLSHPLPSSYSLLPIISIYLSHSCPS